MLLYNSYAESMYVNGLVYFRNGSLVKISNQFSPVEPKGNGNQIALRCNQKSGWKVLHVQYACFVSSNFSHRKCIFVILHKVFQIARVR